MVDEKPALNANLSLNRLAKQISMTPRDLSFVICHGFEENFFDFVGDYRICHVTGLIDLRQEKKTILEIMVDSGFNSKSVFKRRSSKRPA